MQERIDMAGVKEQSLEGIMQFIEELTAKKPEWACKVMFYFLYKEILVNRIAVNEAGAAPNRAVIEHSENLINELNAKLMEQLR